MIGKVIGAFVGDKVAKQTTSIGGPTGAALGVLATSVIARMSIPAMLVLGAGGYAVKKHLDKKEVDEGTSAKTSKNDNQPPKTSNAPAQPAAA